MHLRLFLFFKLLTVYPCMLISESFCLIWISIQVRNLLEHMKSRSEKIILKCKSSIKMSDVPHSFMANILWLYFLHKDTAKMRRLSGC